jgi:uncharacterized membrane protein
MNKTVVALYDDFTSANDVVKELVDYGFAREDISVMSREHTHLDDTELEGDTVNRTAEGAGVGAGIGAALGGISGLLVGVGSLFIPGVGPVLAAGPLVSLLASAGIGAAVGGVTGGLLGALVDMDIPEEHAHQYAEGIRRGGTLVTVRTTEDRADSAVQILNRYDPVNIDERVNQWRDTGWSRFDPESQPYTGSDDRSWPQDVSERSVDYQDDYDLPDDMNEDYGADSPRDYQGFGYYETSFRDHYDRGTLRSQYTYEQMRPVYYYAYILATDDEYREQNWDDLEPDAQRYWEERQPGAWDRFKATIREAWEDIKEAVR